MNALKESGNLPSDKTIISDGGSRGPNKLKEMIMKQSQSDMNKLDHNNVPKIFVNKKGVANMSNTRTVKKQPGLRHFPGDVTMTRKGCPVGAVYAEDLERAEREAKALQSLYEIKPEDLLRQHDFLKIDQSKLPLEIFDNIDVEEKDHTPAVWLASKSAG